MKTKLISVFAIVAMFVAVAAPLQSAYAEKPDHAGKHTNKPGWGWGDKNHHHTGPRGSVRNETNINISQVFEIFAEAGANVTLNVYNTIYNNFFGNNKS